MPHKSTVSVFDHKGDPLWLGQYTFLASLFVPHPSTPTRSQVHHIYLLMHSSQNRSKRKRGKNVGNDDETALAQTAVSRADDAQTDAYGRSRPQAYQQRMDTYIPSTSRTDFMHRDGPSSHADSQDYFQPRTSDGRHRSGRDNHDVTDSRDGDQRRSRISHDSDFQSGGRDRTSRDFVQGYSVTHRNESQGWALADNHDDGPQWKSPSPDRRRDREELEEDRSKGRDNSRNREPRSQGNRRWQSDNGWETRKRDQQQNRRPPDNQDDGSFSKEDRFWEPGPGWNSRGEQTYRNQRGRGGPGKMKGKKNNQNRQRQRGDKDRDHDRRDRRNDNDNLNKCVHHFVHLTLFSGVSSAGKEGSSTLCPPSQFAVLSSDCLLLPGHGHGPRTLSTLDRRQGVARDQGHPRHSLTSIILVLYDHVAVPRQEELIGQDLRLHPITATSPERLRAREVSPLCHREARVGVGARVEVLGTDQGQNTDCHPQLRSEKSPFLYPRPPSDNAPILFSTKNPSRRETRRPVLMAITMYVPLAA